VRGEFSRPHLHSFLHRNPPACPQAEGARGDDAAASGIQRYGVECIRIPVRYNAKGHAREKGIDVRIGLDLLRFAYKGLFDVAVLVSEDSDLDQAVKDAYELRDHERWIAVENAAPWQPGKANKTHWLNSAPRKRRITQAIFDAARDDKVY
jgi:uncharacterized LabA/DUF88 family protein